MESDSTQITGSPAGLKSPRPGDVVCERYEIRDVVDTDALVVTYRAIDQETDGPVLVRATAPGLLGEKEARRVAERLRPLVGARGQPGAASAWPGLLDVERDGAFVATVEPWPRGTSFRAVLEARRAKRKGFDAAELLPLIARLAAALDALPDEDGPLAGLHHGDLRAHRIYVHPDGVVMTGGFLLSALPGDAVAEVLARDLVLRRALAPEVADGLAGRPADRFAIAALAWEAIEGDPPPPSVQPADCRSEPALGAILVRYLDPDPAARPPALRGLVEALAARASVPAPAHDDRLVLPRDAISLDDVERTTETGSYQLADGEILPVDTRPEQRGKEPAASRPRGGASDLDPDLVAAAKAASAISETGTFQLDGEELVPVSAARTAGPGKAGSAAGVGGSKPASAASPARTSAPKQPLPTAAAASPARSSTPEQPAPARVAAPTKASGPKQPALAASPVKASGPKQPAPAKTSQPRQPAPVAAAAVAAAPSASPTVGATPSARSSQAQASRGQASRAQAPPRTAEQTQELGEQDLLALPSTARPRPHWEHATLPATGAALPSIAGDPARPPPAQGIPPTTTDLPAPGAEPASGSGIILIVSAVVLALVILGAAFWYRAYEEQVRHEQEIEQRLRDLRH